MTGIPCSAYKAACGLSAEVFAATVQVCPCPKGLWHSMSRLFGSPSSRSLNKTSELLIECLHNPVLFCWKCVHQITGHTSSIEHSLTCESSNVIYIVFCQKCNIQGVGETDSPTKRFPKYLAAAASSETRRFSSAMEKHFAHDDHCIEDIIFVLLDALPPNFSGSPACVHAKRVRMEAVWISRLQTAVPHGLNVKKQPRFSFTGHSLARTHPYAGAYS